VCVGLIMEDIHISIYILVKINFFNHIKNIVSIMFSRISVHEWLLKKDLAILFNN